MNEIELTKSWDAGLGKLLHQRIKTTALQKCRPIAKNKNNGLSGLGLCRYKARKFLLKLCGLARGER